MIDELLILNDVGWVLVLKNYLTNMKNLKKKKIT